MMSRSEGRTNGKDEQEHGKIEKEGRIDGKDDQDEEEKEGLDNNGRENDNRQILLGFSYMMDQSSREKGMRKTLSLG